MMSLYSILLLVGSAIGQRQAGYVPPVSISTPVATYIPPTTVPSVYLPPTVKPTYLPPAIRTNTVTRTVTETNTLTAEDCRTEDKYASNTYELINQQLILVTQCTKNVLTETVQLTVVTPVNSQVVVRSTTTKIRPTTTIVTNIGDRLALTTVTDTITATMTHRANQFFSTTLTETRTETLTRTTLVISTQVNKRITQVTTTQTVQNTIVVDPPVPAPRIQFAYQPPVARPAGPAVFRPQAAQQSVAQAGITSGQVFGFGGETTGAGISSGQTNLGQSTGAGITSGQVFGFGGETTGAGISSGQATGAGISRRPVLGQAEGFGSGLGGLNAQSQGQAQLGFAQGGFLAQDQSQLQGSRGQESLQAQQQSQAISGQGLGLQGQVQGGFNFGSPSGPAPGLAQFGRPQTRPAQSGRGGRLGSNYQQ